MELNEIYLEIYKEYRSEMRHQETQRSNLSTILATIAAALIAVSFNAHKESTRIYTGVVLVNFSAIALVMLQKLYERFALSRERSCIYLEELNKLVEANFSLEARSKEGQILSFEQIRIKGRCKNEEKYKKISFVRLHVLWAMVLIGVGLYGSVLVLFKGTPLPATIQALLAGCITLHRLVWTFLLVFTGPLLQWIILSRLLNVERSKLLKKNRSEESRYLADEEQRDPLWKFPSPPPCKPGSN